MVEMGEAKLYYVKPHLRFKMLLLVGVLQLVSLAGSVTTVPAATRTKQPSGSVPEPEY